MDVALGSAATGVFTNSDWLWEQLHKVILLLPYSERFNIIMVTWYIDQINIYGHYEHIKIKTWVDVKRKITQSQIKIPKIIWFIFQTNKTVDSFQDLLLKLIQVEHTHHTHQLKDTIYRIYANMYTPYITQAPFCCLRWYSDWRVCACV